MLIDACFNLTHESFRNDEAGVVARAKAADQSVMMGVMIVPMIILGSSLAAGAEIIEC